MTTFREEQNSLRRYLAGLTATTLGVLTALHPQDIASNWIGWLYVASIITNAVSTIFFLFSLFGRSKELKKKLDDDFVKNTAMYSGKDYNLKQSHFTQRFTLYMNAGIICYILTILLMCTYIVFEMCQI